MTGSETEASDTLRPAAQASSGTPSSGATVIRETSAAEHPVAPSPSRNAEAPARPAPPPEPPVAAQSKGPVQTINVRLGDTPDQRMDVSFVHRNGEMQVSVKTDNPELAQKLRGDLPELSQNLSSQGFRSEVRSGSEFLRGEDIFRQQSQQQQQQSQQNQQHSRKQAENGGDDDEFRRPRQRPQQQEEKDDEPS